MDTQDIQNCWEPIIHEKEGVINAFVKKELDSLEERLERTAEGASDEYMVKLEEEEYAKAVKILTDTYAECHYVKHIKDALDKPDFIWDSLFIENIGLKNVDKWYRNPLKADIMAFKKDNTIYDAEHPYFSYIYKVVLYERYVKILLEDQKKHQLLIEIDKDRKRWKEREQKEAEADAFIADMEQKLAERKASLDKEEPKEYTFSHNLKDNEIEVLTECVNKVNMFRTKNRVTKEQLKSILDCHTETILKARSNRLVAHFLGQRIFPVGEAWLIKNKVVPLHHGTNQAASCHPSRCADRQL